MRRIFPGIAPNVTVAPCLSLASRTCPGSRCAAERHALRWCALLSASLISIWVLELFGACLPHYPGVDGGGDPARVVRRALESPAWSFVVAQGVVGCLVARNICPDIVIEMFRHGRYF